MGASCYNETGSWLGAEATHPGSVQVWRMMSCSSMHNPACACQANPPSQSVSYAC